MKKTNLWMFYVLGIVEIVIFIAVFIYAFFPCNRCDRHPVILMLRNIGDDTHTIPEKTGIIWDNKDEYLNSQFGAPVKQVILGNAKIKGWEITDFSMLIDRNDERYKTIFIIEASRGRRNVSRNLTSTAYLTYQELTAKLLTSATEKPDYWKRLIKDLAINDFQESKISPDKIYKNTMPPTPFDPTDKETLVAYHEWLMKITGTPLRDGWETPVRLYLDKSPDATKLIAASAGPDKTWDTEDDMVFIRDLKTHKITKTNKLPEGVVGTE